MMKHNNVKTKEIENSTKKQIKKSEKPMIAPLDEDSMRGYGIGSFVEYINDGKIKKLIEFIAKRDKNDLYNPEKTKYMKRVIYYLRVKNPPYRDCNGKPMTEEEYKKSKCGIKTRKKYRYVPIPKTKYKQYKLIDEDKPTKNETYDEVSFTTDYNSARKRYGGSDRKVGGRCW